MVDDSHLQWAAFNAFGDGQMGRWRTEDRIEIKVSDGQLQVDVDQSGVMKRSEEHTSELQSLMRISYAVFCLKKKNKNQQHNTLAAKPQPTYTSNHQTKIHYKAELQLKQK